MEQQIAFKYVPAVDPAVCKVMQVSATLGGGFEVIGNIEHMLDGSECHYYPKEEGIEHSKALLKAVIAKIEEIEESYKTAPVP